MRQLFCLATLAGLLLCAPTAPAADTLDLNEFKGKVVVLDFWASWCVPCRRSFPWLNEMHARYANDGLVIIGVNLDHDREAAEAFLAEFPADFRIHYDDTMQLAVEYEVQAMPSSFVIGRDGEIVARHLGFKVKRQDEYESILSAALAKEPAQ